MTLHMNRKQFRRLLDLVYVGNWILNSTRGDARFRDYDEVESLVFGQAILEGMPEMAQLDMGEVIPSQAFVEGGIHEAIADYENAIFFDILAEELTRRDMEEEAIDEDDYMEWNRRIEAYISEFEAHGTDNIQIDSDELG